VLSQFTLTGLDFATIPHPRENYFMAHSKNLVLLVAGAGIGCAATLLFVSDHKRVPTEYEQQLIERTDGYFKIKGKGADAERERSFNYSFAYTKDQVCVVLDLKQGSLGDSGTACYNKKGGAGPFVSYTMDTLGS
jgi:hypothetical protein